MSESTYAFDRVDYERDMFFPARRFLERVNEVTESNPARGHTAREIAALLAERTPIFPSGWSPEAKERLTHYMLRLSQWPRRPLAVATRQDGKIRPPADGWNRERRWMEELGIEETDADPVGAVALPLIRRLTSEQLQRKLGRRYGSFARAQKEHDELQELIVVLAREGGQRFEDANMLDLARKVEDEMRYPGP